MKPRASSDLAELLAGQAAERASGLIGSQKGKHRRLICLVRGSVTLTVSNVREEQLIERLVQKGRLTEVERDSLLREAERSQSKPGRLIRESGLVTPEDLDREARDHVRQLVLDTIAWVGGRHRFEPGVPDVSDEITTSIPIARLILEHVAKVPKELQDVRVRIGPPDLRIQVLADSQRVLVEELPDDESVRYLVERAGEPIAVNHLAAGGPAGPEPTYRAIHGLMLLRVLCRADTVAGAAARDAAEAAGIASRDEIESWLVRGNRDGTHYDLLGVSQDASTDEIRSVYFTLARRMHPDRIRSGPFVDLLGHVEQFFTRVTDAYNTLQDPERREHYDRVLRETGDKEVDRTGESSHLARQNFLRGKAAAQRRRLTEALRFFENAVRLDEAQSEFHRELARLLAGNPRRRGDARVHVRRAIELDPSDAENYVVHADLLARTGLFDEALRSLHEALQWDPEHEQARNAIQALEHRQVEGGLLGGLFGGR